MNKRFSIFSVILFFLSLYLLALGSNQIVTQKNPVPAVSVSPQLTLEASASGSIAGAIREQAVVKRVVDGDTIELIDGTKVRYIGINTPETVDPRRKVECFGKEASVKNKELVEGKIVFLEKDVSETDHFGRKLRYLYITLDGKEQMVNELLVQQGYAQSSTYPPDVKYQELFLKDEAVAREQKLGLWNSCY